MFMRSFAARSASRPLVVMAPGWIRTALGGDDAPLSIEETIPHLVTVLLAKQQRPGSGVPGLSRKNRAVVIGLMDDAQPSRRP